MKRLLLVICIAFLLLPFAALSDEITAAELNTEDAFFMTLKRVARLYPPFTRDQRHYHVQQGFASDGEYAYAILENQQIKRCSIWKLDMKDWSVKDIRYGLDLDHGNDMTYNPALGQLLVVHNKPRYTRVSFVDPKTLQVLGCKTMPYQIYCMAYEPTRDQYVIGISGSYDFVILDKDFKKVQRFKGINTSLVKQGCECDENYIYFPQNTSDAKENILMVYDWAGNFVTRIRVESRKEIESLFHIGDDWYIAFNENGSHIYKATLKKDE